MANHCVDHDIYFNSEEAYNYHKAIDCGPMLMTKNICTFLKEGEKCCKESFNTTTALLTHYKDEHQLYACSICYATAPDIKSLEEHVHNESVNLRLRKCYKIQKWLIVIINSFIGPYRCIYCIQSWPTEKARSVHMANGHKLEMNYKNLVAMEYCTICNKSYQHMSSLKRHLQKHQRKIQTVCAMISILEPTFIDLFSSKVRWTWTPVMRKKGGKVHLNPQKAWKNQNM